MWNPVYLLMEESRAIISRACVEKLDEINS